MIKKILRFLAFCLCFFVCGSCFLVVIYKFISPPITPLMLLRAIEDGAEINKEWVDYEEVNKNVFRACIAAEDARFLIHEGIDWRAVEIARRHNELYPNRRRHGASTITMQTAKNTFLWHGRNFVRKGLEAYFTVLIEAVWGKKRILEVYVNIIEWGDGIYGIEAAAQKYFKRSANKLTKRQATLLVATIPNPRKYSAVKPSKYILKRAN